MLLASFTPAAASTSHLAYREARAIYDRGDWAALSSATEKALAEAGSDRSDDVVRLRVLRGAAYFFTRPADAEASLAPELPPSLRNDEVAVIRLRLLAVLHRNQKDGDTRKLLDEAQHLALSRHPRLASEVVFARANLSALYTLAERETFARRAVALASRYPDPRSKVAALAALASILGRQERFQEAVDYGTRALHLATAHHFDGLRMQSEGNLGWFYQAIGDDELAEQYLRDALADATRLGRERDLIPWNLQLGNVAASRRDFAAAANSFREGLSLARKLNVANQVGPALANLASVALETRNYDEARARNDEAIAAKTAAKDTFGILRSRVIDARIDRETNHLDHAQATLQSVLENVHADPNLRLVGWEAETELARVYIARKEPEAAEEQFKDAVDTIDDVRSTLSEELKLPFANLAASFYQSYVDFLVERGQARRALLVAEHSLARTLTEGLKRDPAQMAEVDPEGTARSAGVTVLVYWLAPERSFLFVVTPGEVRQFILPSAGRINAQVDEYQHDLMDWHGSLELSGDRGRRLYETLIGPAAAAIHGTRVVVIPDGHLAAFNFETLVVPAPRPHYWIEDMTIESASSLRFVVPGRRGGLGGRLLIVGNATPADPNFPPLPKAAAEMELVEHHFSRRTTLAGVNATPGAYAAARPETYAFVHFVAHGVADRRKPLDSAVILSRSPEGYKLYGRDIEARPLAARLVTISSCHGAGRRSFRGEGLVGLAWAFLRAGAHEVVAALWEVSDDATPRLMDGMYTAIAAGQAPVDALRTAKLKLLRSKDIFRKARYWAPFVLYSGS